MFGCPIYKVAEMLPASEVQLWSEFYNLEPWGFRADDMLASKIAMQVCSGLSKLKPNVTYRDFMFSDRFESMDLTDQELEQLSQEERDLYINKLIRQAEMVLN